jgi:hypothetical protein
MSFLLNILLVYGIICTIVTTIFLVELVSNLRKELTKTTTVENLANAIKLVYVEQVDDINYLYDGLTHTFITQAPTEDELWANARLQYPNKEFIIEGKDGKAVIVNTGRIQ